MSKLTLHFQHIPDWFGEFVTRCQGRLGTIVGVDVFPEVPGVQVLGRTYLPDGDSNALVNQGAAGADAWIDRFAHVYAENPHVAHWIGPNEFVLWDQAKVDAFNAFHVRFIERMSALGHGVVCGQINTGWPRLRMFGDPPPYPEALAPTLGALYAHGGLFSLHEYGPGDMRDGVGAHCLRYRNTRAELIAAGLTNLPDFVITETGIDVCTDDPASDYDHWGWKHFTDWAGYLEQLQWYSRELDKDPYMRAASIFTIAGDWQTFNLDDWQAFELADWVASDEPEPQPERAWGLDVCRYQGEINWDQVKADGYTFAMIRASGPNNDRTGIEADLFFEANYAGAGSVGLLRGAYHGLVPDFGGQARLFAETVGTRPVELGYWSDLEIPTLTEAKCAAHLVAMDARLAEVLGTTPDPVTGVYTSPAFMAGREGLWAVGRRLWVAHWRHDATLDPIVPEPWNDWEFWQWTNEGTEVPGVPARTCLDVFNGTEAELCEEYGDPSGGNGEGGMIDVVDRNGDPVEGMTWASVQANYGLSLTEAQVPAGEQVFRLVRLVYDDSAETNWRLYVLDEEGRPLPGVAPFLGIQPPSGTDLPANMAPLIAEDTYQQPADRPNRALLLEPNELNFTNFDGYIQHSLGSGSNYVPPGPGTHWCWCTGHYSDVPAGFGMWDNHKMFWPVFQLVTEPGDPEEPEPEPEDGDLAAVVERLDRVIEIMETVFRVS